MSGRKKEIRLNVIKLALAIQLAVSGLIGLDKIGFSVPILREAVIFFYLSFIPGILILRLRDMNLNLMKTFLLSFGISLVFVTLLSAFINVLLASAGFERPISEIPLFISISISVLLLIVICHFKGKPQISFSYNSHLFFSPIFLFLLLLPFVSIIASYISSFRENDFFVLILLTVVGLIPIFISSDKFPEKLYPLIIFSSSISLTFLRFGDIIFNAYSLCETGIAGVIKTVGIWVPNFDCTHNSLLYLTIFHPVFSILSGIDINHQIRITGSLLVSFLPIILYEIYTKFFDHKTSILASFLFLFYPFLNELLGGRTGFAIFFLALLFLTWFSEEINPMLRKAFLILFAFSIITSHYGTAYYFMLLLSAAVVIVFLSNKIIKFSNFMILTFYTLYLIFAFSWYVYTSASANLNWAIGVGKNIYLHLSEFLNPESSATMQAVFMKWGLAQEVTKYLLFAITIFIIIGVVKLLYDLVKKRKDLTEYYIFVLVFLLGLMILLLPKVMGTVRIYAISLLLLAPFSISGFSLLLNGLLRLGKTKEKTKKKMCHILFSILLLLLLLFGSGFISTVMTKVTHKSFDPTNPMNWWTVPNWYDIQATEWLLLHHGYDKLYLDEIFSHMMFVRGGAFTGGNFNFPIEYAGKKVYNFKPLRTLPIKDFLEGENGIEQRSYIYLGYHNILQNFIGIKTETGKKIPLRTSNYLSQFEEQSKIYNNGVSMIYCVY